MDISLQIVTLDDYERLQNMARFYVYDISKAAGALPNWELPESGLFDCYDLKNYITDKDRRAYFVKLDQEIAGFVMINKDVSGPDVDWAIAEFFVLAKFQGRGVGTHVLPLVFKELSGLWEIKVLDFNQPAFQFWSGLLKKLAQKKIIKPDYALISTEILEPEPHIKNIFKVETINDSPSKKVLV